MGKKRVVRETKEEKAKRNIKLLLSFIISFAIFAAGAYFGSKYLVYWYVNSRGISPGVVENS